MGILCILTLRPAPAAVFTVTTTVDSGAGSLRQAITDANGTPGADTIAFNIAGAGVQTITLGSALPVITEAVMIDGTTQPGYVDTPLIDVNGNLPRRFGFSGLFIIGGNCTVRGLIIRNCGSSSSPGSGIVLSTNGGNVIQACFIGTTATGTAASKNTGQGVLIDNSANNIIGGADSTTRNVISGNSGNGVLINGSGASNNVVSGNYIGIGVTGTNPIPNNAGFSGAGGIAISNAANNIIGGTRASAGNVVAGNLDNQIVISGSGASGNQIQGNYIGLRADGTPFSATPSSDNGIRIVNAPGNTIGGAVAGARNVIANCQFGIIVQGSNSTANAIQGNFIGTDPSGAIKAANQNGIYISSGAGGTLIGGALAGAGNVISGNRADGVNISDSSGNIVQGNLIGTDASGTVALGNTTPGAQGEGVMISCLSTACSNNLVGGATAAARNVISGNNDAGISLFGTISRDNLVQGNYIGVAADGVSALGNVHRGVQVLGASQNTIGGDTAEAGNIIANNGSDGVWLAATFGAFGTAGTNNLVKRNTITANGGTGVTLLGANVISENSIYDNVGLGIDRNGDGPTPNVPNGPANYPVLTSARQGSTLVSGRFQGPPKCKVRLEFFADGKFIGKHIVDTDESGNATFDDVAFAPTAAVGSKITATATALDCVPPETSEFSLSIEVAAFTDVTSGHTIGNFTLCGTIGHPVSTFTGELFANEPVDLSLGGPMPLIFQRHYASLLKRDGLIAGRLGDNWLHNFEMVLSNKTSSVQIIDNQGRLIRFTNNAGIFALMGRQDIPFQLVERGGNFILGDPRSQLLYTFESSGKLISIEDGNGNAHTLSYAGDLLTSVSDGVGRTLSFQYSASGFLSNVTDGSRSVGFTQTGSNLSTVTDPLGNVTTFNYDPTNANSGLMTSAVQPEANVPFSQTFSATGRVTTQTEAGTNTMSLIYSNLTTLIVDPLGNVRSDAHTPTGELASFTDEANQTITIESNLAGQRSSVTDRLGNVTSIAYHGASGYPAAITNADGTTTTFTYTNRTASGITFYDLSQITYPDSTSETYTYDANGNLLTRTDGAGKIFTFTYNGHGQLVTAMNPLGGTVTFTYNVDGTVASSADSDIGLTTYAYDSLKRLTNIIHPDGTSMSGQFDADDRLTSLTDERNNSFTFAYDNNGNLTRVTDPNGQVTQLAYDSRNRPTHAIDRLGRGASVAYDTLDHVASITNRNGNVTIFSYDARRRLSSVTDAGGKTWTFGYDNEAILTAFSNPLLQTSTIQADQLGYPTNFTDALIHSIKLTLDRMRRVTSLFDPLSRTNKFGYDSRGLLANAGPTGIGAAIYQRNDLGQLSRLDDLNSNGWRFAHTSMGRVQSITDPLNRANTFAYDARGRLAKTTFADGTIRSNSYDQASNPTRLQYNSGPDLQFSYDALDRLASANDVAFAYDAEGRVTNTVSSGVNYGAAYDADGRLANVTYHAGAFTVTYSYDSRNQLRRVTDSLTSAQLDFAYDDPGRLTGITRANGVNGTYTYDAAGRLTRIQEGSIIDIQFTLDAAGQVTQAVFSAPLNPATFISPSVGDFSYDAAHQINNAGYAYDARGRLVGSPGHSFTYDGASRLVGIDAVALGYNGLNDIITRAQSGTTTRYFYNYALGLAPIVAEKNDTTGQVQRYYVWSPDGALLYMIDATQGNAVFCFHFDQVGSTLALTAGNGTVTDAYAYSPYGVRLGRTGVNQQPFTYIGEFGVRSEPTASLHHMRARYYDSATARFLTRDPTWPNLADAQTLNPYEYVVQNPLTYIDPAGLLPYPLLPLVVSSKSLALSFAPQNQIAGPPFNRSRKSRKLAQKRLRQLSVSIHDYLSTDEGPAWKATIPATSAWAESFKQPSWAANILPYMEQADLYRSTDFEPANKTQVPPQPNWGDRTYAQVMGTSTTIMFGENWGQHLAQHNKPKQFLEQGIYLSTDASPANRFYVKGDPAWTWNPNTHPSGARFGMADGSVRSVAGGINSDWWTATHQSSGDVLGSDW